MGLRVCNIIEEGRYGGPQARIVAVAEGLIRKDIETLIICPQNGSERFSAEARRRGICVLSVRINRLSRKPAGIMRYFLTFGKEVLFLRRMLREENIDIVHCNSARQIKGVVAGWLARKDIIWHLQDTWNPVGIKFLFWAFSFLPDYFIVAGGRVREYYLARLPLNQKPVKVIQAPVDTTVFDPGVVHEDQRIASCPGVKVVSVGNINRAKGYQYFIEAAAHFKKRTRETSFWMVGARLESQRKYHRSLIEEIRKEGLTNVYFYGPSNDVTSVLKAADVYVCSSIHEASPISVWEAMAMGKAIVSTDVGDVATFIADGENGFVVPVGDSRAMAEKIRILIEHPELRAEFGRKAREVACRHFDLTITVQRHFEAYQECLRNRKRRVCQ